MQLTSDQDFKSRSVTKDKKKKSGCKHLINLNLHVPSNITSNIYIKQTRQN